MIKPADETQIGTNVAGVAQGGASQAGSGFDRRSLLIATGAAVAGALSLPFVKRVFAPRQPVFVARNQRYDGPLQKTIQDGLVATGLSAQEFRGKRVLLKPNLVEPTRSAPQMTTHPSVVLAAAEVFRNWGADVVVGEGPGHVRDTEMALVEGGLQAALDDGRLPFADLNYEQVAWTPNRGRVSQLAGFYFPRSVQQADFIVSMPKMKTHHWVGMTGSMKNLYGTIPGVVYGWPKNVLHHAGIPETVCDINASLPRSLAIVDGIMCMEGDGPIMGSPKPMGLILIGPNCTAVDATAARIMGLRPENISYLALAADRLGPIEESRIRQCGERWQDVVKPFRMIDAPHLRGLSVDPGVQVS
ncbi:MAG TPA: DUF362 domain-containing protein [Pirellulales bacterium]|nr:DUF362 domain-containing protein [Pirellulales bacterium]